MLYGKIIRLAQDRFSGRFLSGDAVKTSEINKDTNNFEQMHTCPLLRKYHTPRSYLCHIVYYFNYVQCTRNEIFTVWLAQ